MYCGNNKTALASQRQIADALLSLLAEQPYASVSVSAICRRANVSRQTFYSLFQSKENVITFTLRNDCCYSGPVTAQDCRVTFRQVCGGFSRYIVRHADILKVLEAHDLMPLFGAVLREDFAGCLSPEEPCAAVLRPYMINYLAAGIASIAETYVRAGTMESADELEEVIYRLLRGEY